VPDAEERQRIANECLYLILTVIPVDTSLAGLTPGFEDAADAFDLSSGFFRSFILHRCSKPRRSRSYEFASCNLGSVQFGMLAEGLGFEDETSIRHNLVVHLQSFQH
jgi:hypothetical protein